MKKLIILLMIPIMISGQTVTEKIKARFKEIEKAKQERLKECEELTFFTATTPATLIMKKEYGEWLKEFISLWDEYAKECGDNVDGEIKYLFKDGTIQKIKKEKPTIDGFIEFLRNKLKGE